MSVASVASVASVRSGVAGPWPSPLRAAPLGSLGSLASAAGDFHQGAATNDSVNATQMDPLPDTQVDTAPEEDPAAAAAEAARKAAARPWGKLIPLWGSGEHQLLRRRPAAATAAGAVAASASASAAAANAEAAAGSPGPDADANTYVIGRSQRADIRVADKRVSGRHCALSFREGAAAGECFVLRDLGSANGVHVTRPGRGTKKLGKLETFAIQNGDEITVLRLKTRRGPGGATIKPFCYLFLDLRGEAAPTASSPAAAPLRPSPVPDAEPNAKYDFYKVLGRGACGVVYHARCKETGRDVAVKAIRLQSFGKKANNAATVQNLAREAELMQRLDHPGIIKLHEVITGRACLYIVMELVTGGDLFDRVIARKRLPEGAARGLTKSILEAVSYLHEQGVVHRDLKLENILMVSEREDVEMKLTDFGLAAKLDTDGLRTFCGTPQYFAPEVLRRRTTVHGLGRYGREADMWSVGVILYILLSGSPPFRADHLERQIATGAYNFKLPVWSSVSKAAIHLIRRLIEVDPKKRISARDALNHPWITGAEMPKTPPKPKPKPAPPAQRALPPLELGAPKVALSPAMPLSPPAKAARGDSDKENGASKKRRVKFGSYECERLESWRTRFAGVKGSREGIVVPVSSPKAKRRRYSSG